MPRYFFDIDDCKRCVRDQVGMELPNDDNAMQEASTLLQTLADVRRFEGRLGTTMVKVRDSDGDEIYTGLARLEC